MPDFSSSKIVSHKFHVDNNEGESVIGYEIVIGRDLMLQLGLSAKFKYQALKCYGFTVTMKESNGLLEKTDLTSCKIRNMVM